MNDLRPLRAKSPRNNETAGETLKDHSLTTLHRARTVTARTGTIPALPPEFTSWVMAGSLLHDAGKTADGLQQQIGNTPEPARVWGERHEVLSLGFLPTVLAGLPHEDILWIAAGVVTHHLSLAGTDAPRLPLATRYCHDSAQDFTKKFGPVDADALQDLTAWLHTTASREGLVPDGPAPTLTPDTLIADAHALFFEFLNRWDSWERPLVLDDDGDGLTAVLLQGAVTMADRIASARTPVHTRHPLTPAFTAHLAAKGYRLRAHQQDAAATSGHVIIRAWTGSGKTEAALLWALRNLEEMTANGQGTPRLFYLLPYLAAINSMVTRLEKDLDAAGQIGVAHSHAASYYLARALADDCTHPSDPLRSARQALAQDNSTRLFRELVRVGTPYQPLRGTLAGPAHSSVLYDTANSLFILDELHAYDPRRLGMILAMMRFWERTGGRIAIVSATLPDALKKAIKDTLDGDVSVVQPPSGTVFPQRHRLGVRPHQLSSEAALAEMQARIEAGEALLVVANNRPTARALYRKLGSTARRVHGDRDAAILLHSRYRRDHRADIEQRIRTRYQNGRNTRPGGLLVATQTVEVSLDVDFDSIHTACAPMDALCQRFGRVNRNGTRSPADVIVHAPHYLPRSKEPGLYADGVYPKAPVDLAWNKLQNHDGAVIDEAAITVWLNEIYADSTWGDHWNYELRTSRTKFTDAFLTWTHPFHDRSDIRGEFERLFDGKEAICTQHRDEYKRLLTADNGRKPGRLLAEDLLIPVSGTTPTEWDDELKIHTVDAPYDPEYGLGNPRR